MVRVNGNRVKAYRKLKRLSQIELAEKINVTSAFIGFIETNKRGASIDTLKKLADLFDTTIEELIREDN